jgi:hypothetical protein
MKDAPPARKAYSSPVQRTKSLGTELDHCAPTAAQALDSKETNCGINEDALKGAQNRPNEDKAEVYRNAVEHGLLKDKNNQLAVDEQSLQDEPSHNLKALTENSLESKQRSPSKIKMQLQPSLDSPAHTEKSTRSDVTSSRTKKNNPYAPDQSKRNKLTAGKENSSQDLHALGPDLNVTTVKNKGYSCDASQNYSQRQTDKFTSVMMVKSSKPVSKNDANLKQSSLTVNSVMPSNWTTVSQNEVAVEHVTESKLQNLTVAENQLLRETSSTLGSAAEVKSKRSLRQTKQATENAEKHVSMRKKSKCEETSSFVDSCLAVLNSLAGKGKFVHNLFTYFALDT